jgi:hypothetical protein
VASLSVAFSLVPHGLGDRPRSRGLVAAPRSEGSTGPATLSFPTAGTLLPLISAGKPFRAIQAGAARAESTGRSVVSRPVRVIQSEAITRETRRAKKRRSPADGDT